MIAIIPVRFTTNTNPASTWSDVQLRNWMHLSIPFSLGHYWWVSGWAGLDLNHVRFPEIVIDDPRLAQGPASERDKLCKGCIEKAQGVLRANGHAGYDDFDIVFFWFAQRTDMFGGGAYAAPLGNGGSKTIRVTVTDPDSWFSACCQELGHSLGFDHELSSSGEEYGSPYSAMSARGPHEFLRAADPRLPDGGIVTIPPDDPFVGKPAQRIIGPALPASQLYAFKWFRNSSHVIRAGFDGNGLSPGFKLYALDYARDRRDQGLLTLGVLDCGSGLRYGLELRRAHGFDQAVPPAVTLHSFSVNGQEDVIGRITFRGAVPLSAYPAPDWPAGPFTLRILEVAGDHSYVRVSAFQGVWYELDNNPSTVDIVADGAALYQRHGDGKIWRYTGVPHTGWAMLDQNPATKKIVASGGQLYQLHGSGRIWKYVGTPYWQELDNNPDTVDIVADGAALYQLHGSGKVWKYTGVPHTGWAVLDQNPATKKIVAGGGQLYQLHDSGRIWKYVGTPYWQELDNNPDTIDIVTDGGDLYQQHRTGKIWKYTGVPHTGWLQLDNNPSTKQITASGGRLFQIHENGRIWRYTGMNGAGQPHWFELDHNEASMTLVASPHALYQLHRSGRIWKLDV